MIVFLFLTAHQAPKTATTHQTLLYVASISESAQERRLPSVVAQVAESRVSLLYFSSYSIRSPQTGEKLPLTIRRFTASIDQLYVNVY
jgi:hypothetical protein